MILQALTQYYEDLVEKDQIARPGWAKAKISYALCIDTEGELKQIIPLIEETGGKKPQPQQFNLPAPVKRTMGIASNFLWDNSTYLLGKKKKKNPERSMKCFKVCKELHHTLLDGKDNDVIRGVLNFFDHWEPSNADNCPVLKDEYDAIIGGANLLFRVNGEFVHDNNDVRSAWQDYYDHIEGDMRQCLVTGKESVIAAVHPAIKGVDGAQSTGAAMVSFNASAFCSYGQDR